MVSKVKLQYSTYITVAGSGQVDSGVSNNFESEVIYLGLVYCQQSVCCKIHLGLQKKSNLFVSVTVLVLLLLLYNRITIMITYY